MVRPSTLLRQMPLVFLFKGLPDLRNGSGSTERRPEAELTDPDKVLLCLVIVSSLKGIGWENKLQE